jgi:predicted helicase
MKTKKSYIYVRSHESYDNYDAYKLGRTHNVPERDDTYSTSEIKRGQMISVFEVSLCQVKKIERELQEEFCNMNVRFNAGIEFYKKEIIELIEPYFQKNGIEYRTLDKKEIDGLLRMYRIQKIRQKFEEINKAMIQKIERKYAEQEHTEEEQQAEEEQIIPNHHQQYVLDSIVSFYRLNDIGKLEWACGLGKALLSIFSVATMHFKTVIIGVPSNYLQKQMKKEILKIYPDTADILYVGGEKDPTDEIKRTTKLNKIKAFLKKENNRCKFIITTYHSCKLLVDDEIHVDFKIGDEAHHLVGIEQEEEKGFRSFHKIKSIKSLFMTATEKTIITRNRIEREIYSMDDESIFGKTIDTKSVNWAIENKKITDYCVLVLKNTEEEVNNIITRFQINVSNKEIFISAYMTLKSFEKYCNLTHLLLYTNTTEDAELAKKYIDEILNMNVLTIRKEDVYNNALHSKNSRNLEEEVGKFKRSSYGIVSCVYIFGEGFDLPKLNGVCVAGNMQSVIRIVQYLLRPNRLDQGNPNKHAYVIIPYIDTDDWENEDNDNSFEKVRNVVSQLRNVDENIEQKIFVSLLTTKQCVSNENEERKVQYNETFEFEENCDELTKIKLRLRYSKALGSKFTEEQDEFNYVKSINHSLHISSKREYIRMEHRHSNFIHNAEEYFKAKGVWTNWYDFMGVDTMKFIQSKQDWIKFCKEKNVISLDSYYECCEIYQELPKEPADFYRDFTNISNEIGFYQKRRR